MADTDRITQPSSGSNELGTETNDTPSTGRVSAGTDTQLHLTALGGKKHKKDSNVNDDEKVVMNPNGENSFLKAEDTDE
jgi:hypothetical protein